MVKGWPRGPYIVGCKLNHVYPWYLHYRPIIHDIPTIYSLCIFPFYIPSFHWGSLDFNKETQPQHTFQPNQPTHQPRSKNRSNDIPNTISNPPTSPDPRTRAKSIGFMVRIWKRQLSGRCAPADMRANQQWCNKYNHVQPLSSKYGYQILSTKCHSCTYSSSFLSSSPPHVSLVFPSHAAGTPGPEPYRELWMQLGTLGPAHMPERMPDRMSVGRNHWKKALF